MKTRRWWLMRWGVDCKPLKPSGSKLLLLRLLRLNRWRPHCSAIFLISTRYCLPSKGRPYKQVVTLTATVVSANRLRTLKSASKRSQPRLSAPWNPWQSVTGKSHKLKKSASAWSSPRRTNFWQISSCIRWSKHHDSTCTRKLCKTSFVRARTRIKTQTLISQRVFR